MGYLQPSNLKNAPSPWSDELIEAFRKVYGAYKVIPQALKGVSDWKFEMAIDDPKVILAELGKFPYVSLQQSIVRGAGKSSDIYHILTVYNHIFKPLLVQVKDFLQKRRSKKANCCARTMVLCQL
jgi:hypothetical protein